VRAAATIQNTQNLSETVHCSGSPWLAGVKLKKLVLKMAFGDIRMAVTRFVMQDALK
jgi:hypothetical protein